MNKLAMKKILTTIAWVVAIPFILVLFLLVLPVMAFVLLRDAIALRVYRHRNHGAIFLICTSRRGWYDYLRNNLIPILPANVRVVWQANRRDGKVDPIITNLWRSRIFGVPRPYLVAVHKRRISAVSLNGCLQDLKARPARSPQAQEMSRHVLLEQFSIVGDCWRAF